jgi:Flp pilus assembly protein TadG
MVRLVSRERLASQSGSTIVEFALVVPIFFLLIFGFIAFAIIFAGYCSAAYASQAAVRYAIVHGNNSSYACSNTDITALVAPYLWAAQSGGSTVTTTWTPDNSPGSTVSVTISLTYKTAIPYSALHTVHVGAFAQGTILF